MTPSMNYVECDVPEGMTLEQYRRRGGQRPRRLSWLLRRTRVRYANTARASTSASTRSSTSSRPL